jgi:hypothetical protein
MNSAITSQHWDKVFRTKAEDKASWFEAIPEASIQLIESAQLPKTAPIIDVGAGLSRLASELIARGYVDVTVLDIFRRSSRSLHRPDGTKYCHQGDRRRYCDMAAGPPLSALA